MEYLLKEIPSQKQKIELHGNNQQKRGKTNGYVLCQIEKELKSCYY